MGRSDIKAGGAYVELLLRDSKFTKGIAAAGRQLASFAKSAALLAGPLAGAFSLGKAISAASTLEETMNKFNVVFGENSARVKQWGNDFAQEVGRSEEQIARFMSNSQDLFVPLGFEAGAAEDMSKQITKLSIDLASFNNLQDADTMRDLQGALTGSGEVMKKYGVLLSEAAVKQELLNQGLNPAVVNNQEKVQARLNIIMKGTTAAQGDAIRSSGSFANQLKALWARVTDVAAIIGSALLPGVTQLVAMGAKAASSIQRMAESGMGRFGEMLSAVSGYAQSLWTVVTEAFQTILDFVTPIVQQISDFVIAAFTTIYDYVQPIVSSLLVVVQDVFTAIWNISTAIWTGIVTIVKAAWDAVGGYVTTALNWLQSAITGTLSVISFAFTNWRLLLDNAIVSVLLSIFRFSNQVVHLFSEVIPTWLVWFSHNWRDIFYDIGSITKTVAANIWKNLSNLWDGILGLFNGDGFTFEWTPLTKGFKSVIKELPKIAEREMGPVEQALQDRMNKLGKEINKEWEQHGKRFADRVEGFTPDEDGFGADVTPPSPVVVAEAAAKKKKAEEDEGKKKAASPNSKKMNNEVLSSFSLAEIQGQVVRAEVQRADAKVNGGPRPESPAERDQRTAQPVVEAVNKQGAERKKENRRLFTLIRDGAKVGP